jgi:translation initiation factor 1
MGRICGKCGKPAAGCLCKKKKPGRAKKLPSGFPDDGIVRIKREVKGRKGKTATVIIGIPLDDNDLKQFAKELKQGCGTGGSVKDGAIIIQGDHRKTILDKIKKKGYKAKIAGG